VLVLVCVAWHADESELPPPEVEQVPVAELDILLSMPELEVWANAMCPLIADVLTTNTLASAAIATSAVEIL
jgi:hypothetical protein